MSATEAQLGLADEFEFEFDLKFDDRVRIRVSSSGFWVVVSVASLEYPFLGIRFRSLFGSIWGPIFGPFGDPFSGPFGDPFGDRKRPLGGVSQLSA